MTQVIVFYVMRSDVRIPRGSVGVWLSEVPQVDRASLLRKFENGEFTHLLVPYGAAAGWRVRFKPGACRVDFAFKPTPDERAQCEARLQIIDDSGTTALFDSTKAEQVTETARAITYSAFVAALAKPGADILTSLTPEACHLWHMASCIPEEAGEVFGTVKKHIIYGKPLDREAVIKEMGDLEFYLEGLRQGLGISRDVVIAKNIDKLSTRYASGTYSDKQAVQRVDAEVAK